MWQSEKRRWWWWIQYCAYWRSLNKTSCFCFFSFTTGWEEREMMKEARGPRRFGDFGLRLHNTIEFLHIKVKIRCQSRSSQMDRWRNVKEFDLKWDIKKNRTKPNVLLMLSLTGQLRNDGLLFRVGRDELRAKPGDESSQQELCLAV